MATEEQADLVELIRNYLANDRPEELLPMVKCPSRKEQLVAVAWDLIPVVCEFLTAELENTRRCVVSGAAEILRYLASVGNPKELLLVFLEQADTFKDDIKFCMLLPPIQTCLLRLPSKRSHSLAIALETLNAHVESLPLPEERQFEGREKLLLDFDLCVRRATEVVPAYLEFIVPFVEEVSWLTQDHAHRAQHRRQIRELTRCLLKILSHPLAYIDLAINDDADNDETTAKSGSRSCAEDTMKLLGQLQPNFVSALLSFLEENKLIEHRQSKTLSKNNGDHQEDEPDRYNLQDTFPETGLCVFSYLAFGERICSRCLPQTYSHTYILQLCLPSISQLLDGPESLLVGKGLSFLASLLPMIRVLTLSASCMGRADITQVICALLQVMTSSKVKELCQTAVKLLGGLMHIFQRDGRHLFIHYILNTSTHNGVLGYAVTLLKNEIDESLKLKPPSKSFTGLALEKLLKLVFTLPNAEKTDLMENSERIMAALNLLRYLILRDLPTDNVTGIWDLVPNIEKTYCEPLRAGLNMSRAHYQLEIKQIKESKGRNVDPAAQGSFSVGGEDIPEPDAPQQIHMLNMAVHTFDMMESILGRVGELIQQQRKLTQTE